MKTPRRKVQRVFIGLTGRPFDPEEFTPAASTSPPIPVKPQAKTEPLTCEYNQFRGQWVCLYCAHCASENDMTAEGIPAIRVCPARNIQEQNKQSIGKEIDKKQVERERRAKAARERRKARADQRAAIKKALQTPIAVIKEVIKTKAEAEKLPSMNQGKYISDAPTGKGALVYKPTEKIEQIDAALTRAMPLGSPTIDEETDEAFFPEQDRKHVSKKMGAGSPSDEKPEITGVSSKGFTYKEEPRKKFQVKLNGPEYQSGLSSAVNDFTVEEGGETFCRLCEAAIIGRSEDHFKQIHGDPSEPGHDKRFGDIVQKYVKKFVRKHAKLEKAGHKIALEAAADRKIGAAIEATREGWVKVNGEWVRSK